MNNKSNLFTITLTLCALLASSETIAQSPGCANSSLRLKIDLYELWLNDKKPICIAVDTPFSIVVQNPPGADWDVKAGDVTIEDKRDDGKPNAYEISGNNSANEKFVLGIVTGTVIAGEEYAFWIHVKGVGTLDPRVRVVDSDTFRRSRFEAAIALLNSELNMVLEELSFLVREFAP